MPEKIDDTTTRALVKEIFAELMPVIKELAFTPDKMREAQKPWTDPAKLAQQLHQRKLQQENDAENQKLIEGKQAACPHKDEKGGTTVQLVHNYPDNQPRGLCSQCDLWIEPGHYDWRPITLPDGSIKEDAKWVKQHSLYWIVKYLESKR